MSVTTVRGRVSASELGVTLPHEHIFIDQTKEYRGSGLLNSVDLAVIELADFVEAGGQTIVDVTSIGLGRNPSALRRVAEATAINIVTSTGVYRHQYHDPDWIDRMSVASLADLFVQELTEGIDGTDICAGLIGEIASDEWITAAEERCFRAAARAHLATGATISTHAARWPVGLDQLDLLEEEHVDLTRVVVGHCDTVSSVEWSERSDVLRYHEAIARRGAYVAFDTIRKSNAYELQRRVDYIRNLFDAGFSDQILLSHDVCLTSHLKTYGGGGYTFILTDFLPKLIDAGLSSDDVDKLVRSNPREALVHRAG